MEWLESIKKAIDIMEENLLNSSGTECLEKEIFMSPLYLQKGFKVMTGFTPAEYIRNRRLYLSALDVINDKEKIIDIAFKYGYETPESFTKAFTRFHGLAPIQLKKEPSKIKVFLPLKISIQIQGGNDMDFSVEKVKNFKVIGFKRRFNVNTSYEEIPKFWSEIYQEQVLPFCQKADWPQDEIKKAIAHNNIGQYGVCLDSDKTDFDYLIAGIYKGGEVPNGLEIVEIPELTFAKFKCQGPMPSSLQSVNTKIYKEWLPGNPTCEIDKGYNIEFYSDGDPCNDSDYKSEIWISVKEK